MTAGSLVNEGEVTLSKLGAMTLNGAGLDNRGTFTLAGGVLQLDGFENYSMNTRVMKAYGTITGTGTFANFGNFTQEGGDLTLSSTVYATNYGAMTLAPNKFLNLNNDAALSNQGLLNLNGGMLNGTGSLSNAMYGTMTGSGTIFSNFSNYGTMLVSAGQTINLFQGGVRNEGVIQLGGPTARLGGFVTGGGEESAASLPNLGSLPSGSPSTSYLNNFGTIEGAGQVAIDVDNYGSVEALGGTLVLSGSFGNYEGGMLRATTGNKILINAPLYNDVSNYGTISLAGGTVDTSNRALFNYRGNISGYGILRPR